MTKNVSLNISSVHLITHKTMNSDKSTVTDIDYSDLAFLPVKYPRFSALYDTLERTFWHNHEINWSNDRNDWDTLDSNVQTFLQFFLFFFAQADGLVNENLFRRFKKDTRRYKEAAHFYAMQEANETIHSQVYSIMIETFIRDTETKRKGFQAIQHYPSIRKIAEWVEKFMDKKLPILERVVGFACLEGVLFTGAFATIYWIKKYNKLDGLTTANRWIARDERVHLEFALELYYQLEFDINQARIEGKVLDGLRAIDMQIPSAEKVRGIIESCVDTSSEFIKSALRVELIGMNADDLISYVKCVANSLSSALDAGNVYPGQSNPLDWMVVIGLPTKPNFFERTPTEYQRSKANPEMKFTCDADY